MGHIEKAKRNEALLFPEYLDDYVESDCPVHFPTLTVKNSLSS